MMTARTACLMLTVALTLHGGCKCNQRPPAAPASVPAPREDQSSPLAYLESTQGYVQVERTGKLAQAAQLGYLYLKDTLETGPGGQAEIRLDENRSIRVGPNSRVVIEQDATGRILNLLSGKILSRIAQSESPSKLKVIKDKMGFSILTPSGLVRLTGTLDVIEVDVQKDKINVDVESGKVEFVSRDGKSQSANGGQRLEIASGKLELVSRNAQDSGPTVSLDSASPQKIEEVGSLESFVLSGQGQIRKKSSGKWIARSGKMLELEQGDAFRAGGGKELNVLSVKDSDLQVTIQPASEIKVESVSANGSLQEIHLELKKGSLAVRPSSQKKGKLVMGGVEFANDESGFYTVVRKSNGFEVQSVANDLMIRLGGKEQMVKAGQSAMVGPGGIQIVDRGIAAVSIATAQGLKVFHPGVEEASLTWTGGGKDYRVVLSADPEFKEVLIQGKVHHPYLTTAIPRRGSLFWKVLEEAGTGAEVHRGNAVFAPEPKSKDLDLVQDEVPDGREKTTVFFQDKVPSLKLTFNPFPNGTKYRLSIFSASNFNKPIYEEVASSPSVSLKEGTLEEGNYVWSVTPLAASGEGLKGGKMNKLEIIYDNAVPALIVRAPRNGDLLSPNSEVSVVGTAPLGAKVLVNGKQASFDEKNRFRLKVTPLGGRTPFVLFRLIKPSSPETYTIRVLRRSR